MAQQPDATASSTGQSATAAGWLDVHFEASRPEYEAQLRMVGIQPGWRVLDAGCGSGSFLPWLADLVGRAGEIVALDLAPENVAVVKRRLADWRLPCSVETQIGSVLTLASPDDGFDAAWFANTSQYLTDEELGRALAELRRVVRPGGLVAVKESDVNLWRLSLPPGGLALRWWQAFADSGSVWGAGALRGPQLSGWLRRAGLVDIWQHSTLIERSAPLQAPTRAMWTTVLGKWATAAPEMNLPAGDQEAWAHLRDPAALEHYLDDSDCCLIEGNILVVGIVPEDIPVAEVTTNHR